jgi:hypothetical protein
MEGVPPETMKMQPRILHYVQDDSSVGGARSLQKLFSRRILHCVDRIDAINFAQDESVGVNRVRKQNISGPQPFPPSSAGA